MIVDLSHCSLDWTISAPNVVAATLLASCGRVFFLFLFLTKQVVTRVPCFVLAFFARVEESTRVVVSLFWFPLFV